MLQKSMRKCSSNKSLQWISGRTLAGPICRNLGRDSSQEPLQLLSEQALKRLSKDLSLMCKGSSKKSLQVLFETNFAVDFHI